MNKAKTLKRYLGNPQPSLSVAWNTDDITSRARINLNFKWKDIDWKWVLKNVFKLQKLIYRASSRGEISKMRKYQKLLTKSYYPRLRAVRYVIQENQGKKTAGVGDIKNLPPMQRLNLVNPLKLHYLKASPICRVSITKPEKEQKRSLVTPRMYESALQALVKLGMEAEWGACFEPNSYGFRPRQSTQNAIQAIYTSISHQPKYVLDADMSKCFDQINHDALLRKIGQSPYRHLIKQWLKSGVLDKNQFHPSRQLPSTHPYCYPSGRGWGWVGVGTPQGGLISPLLANIALHGMEQRLIEFAKTLNMKNQMGRQMSWQIKCQSLTLVRYAGKFVILHEDIKVVVQAKTLIQEWSSQIGLELKPEKTKIAHTLEEYKGNKPGFNFLGFTVRQGQVKTNKEGFKILIKPSPQSIKTHYSKLVDICDSHRSAPVEALIAKLNPAIRGWANYYSTQASKEIFQKLDMFLWKKIWRWASRRHPNKSHTWVKKKYFPQIENDTLVLNNGEYILNRDSDVPIIRHIKVKGNKSPYNSDWTYWSNRICKYPRARKEVTTLLK